MDKYLGHATAYGYAKSKGYTGTEEEFAELMASYATVAESAAASAESAAESATTAGAAKDAAVAAKTAAETASGTANTKASEASASATSAASSATTAEAASTTATVKASEASTSAQTASDKALEASTSATAATAAQTAAETAQTAAEDAADRAETAAETFTTDITLTIAGKAADAKVTGDKIRNALPLETASGAVASFSDGSDLFPAEGCKVSIGPVQDLHGYDSPWPAGGGKNLCDGVLSSGYYDNVSFTLAQTSSTIYKSFKLDLKPGTYTLSFGVNCNIIRKITDGAMVSNPASNVTSYTFTVEEEGFAGFSFRNSANTDWDVSTTIQLEAGSTATSYAPYSNICPITGWTGMTVTKIGKNLLNSAFCSNRTQNGLTTTVNADGSITLTGTASSNTRYFNSADTLGLVLPPGTYTLSSGLRLTTTGSGTRYGTFTLTEEMTFINAYIVVTNGQSYNTTIYPQLERGSTATPYEPYQATTIPITWQSEVGTVYGGTLDVVSGELIVDRAMITPHQDNPPTTKDDKNRWKLACRLENPAAGMINKQWNIIDLGYRFYCSELPFVKESVAVAGMSSCYPYGHADYVEFRVRIADTYTEQEALNIFNSLQISYPCTPTTYHLTPQEVEILLGNNTIWADCGDTEVKYRADVQRYIGKKLAEIEALILEN